MEDKILQIAIDFEHGIISQKERIIRLYELRASVNSWIPVNEFKPPNEEVLARDSLGNIYLTHWRDNYTIFTCQNKGESSNGWSWKYV